MVGCIAASFEEAGRARERESGWDTPKKERKNFFNDVYEVISLMKLLMSLRYLEVSKGMPVDGEYGMWWFQ